MFTRFGGLQGRCWRRSFLRHLRRRLHAGQFADAEAMVRAVSRDAGSIYDTSPKPGPKRKACMIVNICSLVLATYRVVQAKTNDSRLAFRTAQETMEATFRAPVRMMLWVYLKLWRDPVAKLSGIDFAARGRAKYGTSMQFDQEHTADGIDLLVRRCSFHQFFVEHGVPGLTLAVCNWDRNWMDGLNRSPRPIHAERPSTISTGGDCCRFRFVRDAKGQERDDNEVVLIALSAHDADSTAPPQESPASVSSQNGSIADW